MGFRSAGQFSLYCDQDPVFQFNAQSQLRRVYYQGRKLKAEQGSLMELTRGNQRTIQSPTKPTAVRQVKLTETPIGEEQQTAILDDLKYWLQLIQQSMQTDSPTENEFACVGAEPRAFKELVLAWMEKRPSDQVIADGPGL